MSFLLLSFLYGKMTLSVGQWNRSFFQMGLFVFVKEFSPKNGRHKIAIKWVCNDGSDVSGVYP